MNVIIQANHFANKIQMECTYDNSSDCNADYQQPDDEHVNNNDDSYTEQPCSEAA